MPEYNIAIQRLFDQMPSRFKRLPISPDGFPVPKFVGEVNGKPDFRAIDGRWFMKAWKQRLCWLCGEPLGKFMAFVIGPMCAVNRINSEPPSHLECAQFAVKACPFMTQPNRKRNEENLPKEAIDPAGIHIERNPGVSLIWVTKSYSHIEVGEGVLFKIGHPTSTEWWARGRAATQDEIMHSITTGMPTLRSMAEREGPDSVKELEKNYVAALRLLPRLAGPRDGSRPA